MKFIKKDDEGAEVRVLQEILVLSGSDIGVDGGFGANTFKAVKAFQSVHVDEEGNALDADGKVGDSTWWALLNYDKYKGAPPVLQKDPYTLRKLKKIHPSLISELTDIYDEILARGVNIRITDSLRTMERQSELYAQGRTKPGPRVTNAKPGQSYHNFGMAIDFALLLPGNKRVSWDLNLDLNNNQQKDWDEVVAVFKHFGWDWGGNWTSFKDYPHFEKTFGYSTSQLLAKYNNGEVERGYVKI